MHNQTKPWVVLKFGGTSVASKAKWQTIHQVAKDLVSQGKTPILVCSAVSGISNKLDALVKAAEQGTHQDLLKEIKETNLNLAKELDHQDTTIIDEELTELDRIIQGISLIGQTSPRITAKVMAMGELMSTKIGAKWLQNCGLKCSWMDVRDVLEAKELDEGFESQEYLSAVCEAGPDFKLQHTMADMVSDVIVTQGFLAKNAAGHTVLLGRGGSDTSAAYIASKLQAERLEIWTDVPGMFTSNPKVIPSARLLLNLDFDEAQELATSGAKVLHPRCIEPLRIDNIPLHIRWTDRPDYQPAIIGGPQKNQSPKVKAVLSKKGTILISMEAIGMWQAVGFLADIFKTFQRFGLSIDLVATSETNVTVSLDPQSNVLENKVLDRLMNELSQFCIPKKISPCATVSLVGKNIRAILHELGPAFETFEDKRIYLVSQAASDLNFTFAVDESEADRLAKSLHALFFSVATSEDYFGDTWSDLFIKKDDQKGEQKNQWWKEKKDQLLSITRSSSPAYVYDRATMLDQCQRLKNLSSIDHVHFAMKANPHPEILRMFYQQGLGFDCVSEEEIKHLQQHVPDLDAQRILFTPNFAPINEYKFALELGCRVTLDNLHPIEKHPDIFAGKEILVRIDPGIAKGHHKHVRTAGPQSKFGVALSEIATLKELCTKHKIKVIGLHSHVGSGIQSPETWAEIATSLAAIAEEFPEAYILDLGGGLGIAERPGQKALDLEAAAEILGRFKESNPKFQLWIEPGRFLVSEAGVLLSRVTQIKYKGEKTFVGLDTGMNSLIRPPLYGAFHQIVNLDKFEKPNTIVADVVGPICESGDVMGHSRQLPETEEGDTLLIATAGAYGRSMSSHYNLRQPAEEHLI